MLQIIPFTCPLPFRIYEAIIRFYARVRCFGRREASREVSDGEKKGQSHPIVKQRPRTYIVLVCTSIHQVHQDELPKWCILGTPAGQAVGEDNAGGSRKWPSSVLGHHVELPGYSLAAVDTVNIRYCNFNNTVQAWESLVLP